MARAFYDKGTGLIVLTLDGVEDSDTLTGWLGQVLDEMDMSPDQAEVLSGILNAVSDQIEGNHEW